MPSKNTYHPGSKALHWGIGLLWLATLCLGIYSSYTPEGWNPGYIATLWHKAIGSSILFLVAVRIAWRLSHRVPDLPASMSPTAQRSSVTLPSTRSRSSRCRSLAGS